MGAYKYYNPATQQWEITKAISIIKSDGSLEYTPDDIKAIDDKIGILNGAGESQEKANKSLIGTLTSLLTTAKTNLVAAINEIFNDLSSHKADNANPHEVTKSQVGLGSVQNYAIATQAEAEAGTSNAKYVTPLRVKQAIAKIGPGGHPIDLTGLAEGKVLKYRDAKWVIDFGGIGHVYNLGTEIYEMIEGMTNTNTGTASFSKMSSYINIKCTRTGTSVNFMTARTNFQVDLTDTKVVYFEVANVGHASNQSNYTTVGVGTRTDIGNYSSTTGNYEAYQVMQQVFPRQVIGIDVSSLIGTYYIGVTTRDNSSNSAYYSETNIYRIWGE